MSPLETVAIVAAKPPPPPGDPGGQGADFGKSSPVGLILLILFFIAVAFLVRSMTKHLKKLPTTFDEAKAEAAAPARAKRAEAHAQDSEDERGSAESSESGKAKRDNGSTQPT